MAGFDVERSFTESLSKGSKGKVGVELDSVDSGSSTAQDPPPPRIEDVTGDNLEALPYSRTARRISFLPGQEGGERRESYLEGTLRNHPASAITAITVMWKAEWGRDSALKVEILTPRACGHECMKAWV